MGFNVDRHVVIGGFDAELLKTSLPGVPFVATHVKGHNGVFLFIDEGIRREAAPIGLPPPYDALDSLHQVLSSAGATVAFSRDLVILNLKLSELFGGKVLSIDSNDDQRDLAVESANGSLVRINFKTEDTEFVVEHGQIHVHPLITESDDQITLNPSLFSDGPYILHGRDKAETYDVNRIARASLRSFLDTQHDVVEILLEDLSHEDEHLVVRHEGRASSHGPGSETPLDDVEPLQIAEFVIDSDQHRRFGLGIDFTIGWIDELVESIGSIKDACADWVATRGDDAGLIRLTVEAAAADHAEIDALIRVTFAQGEAPAPPLHMTDLDVTIRDPIADTTVHYTLRSGPT